MLPLFIALLVSIAIICAALQRMRKSHNALRERFVADDALMSIDITEEDKYLYFLIIDMFVQNLDRDPTEEELLDSFSRLKTNEITMHDVYNRIVGSDEYYMMNPSRPVPDLKEPNAPRVSDYDIVYAMLLEEMPEEKDIFYEKSDNKGFMSYVLSKYVAFDRDLERTREFVRRTPEYADARSSHSSRSDMARSDTTRSDMARSDTTVDTSRSDTSRYDTSRYDTARSDTTVDTARSDMARSDTTVDTSRYDTARYDTARSDTSRYDTTVDTARSDTSRFGLSDTISSIANTSSQDPIEDPVVDYADSQFDESLMDIFDGGKTMFNLNRPHLGRNTLDVTSTSQRYDEAVQREELKEANACEMYAKSQKLSHLIGNRDMEKLRYKCELSKGYANVHEDLTLLPDQTWSVPQKHTPVCHRTECAVNDPYAQSSLIGTLLGDARDGRIMPKFEYSEA